MAMLIFLIRAEPYFTFKVIETLKSTSSQVSKLQKSETTEYNPLTDLGLKLNLSEQLSKKLYSTEIILSTDFAYSGFHMAMCSNKQGYNLALLQI